MKKIYKAPVLEEYGRVDQLTQGSGGTLPDYQLDPGVSLKLVNNDCDASGPATSCLVVAS